MLHCSIVRCNYKQTNRSEVTYFNLPKEPQKQKTWFAVISIDKDNLPSIYYVFVCSDNSEDIFW